MAAGLNIIGSYAFVRCTGLTSISVGDNVVSIGNYAFSDCTALAYIVIGNKVNTIGSYAFAGCSGLAGAYFAGNAPLYVSYVNIAGGVSEIGYVFQNDNKATVYYLAEAKGWGSTFGGRPTAIWEADRTAHPKSVSYRIVSSKRISKTVWEYAYTFDIENLGNGDAFNVSAQLNPLPSQVTVVNGRITFPNLGAGATVTSKESFKILIDLSQPVFNSDLTWELTFNDSHIVKRVLSNFFLDPNIPQGMALIPVGTFTMGDNSLVDPSYKWHSELPAHSVYVSAFYMDKYEVTKGLWDNVKDYAISHGYRFDFKGLGTDASHPVIGINWYDMVKWCNARSEMEGRVPSYYTSDKRTDVYRSGQVDVHNDWVNWNGGYRLPTEAEWEKAARGGTSGWFPWGGDKFTFSQANSLGHPSYSQLWGINRLPTSPVGSFEPNGYGLYDMAGNVMEWCWDWSDAYPGNFQRDPRGPNNIQNSYRVFRGGSFALDGWYECRVWRRTFGSLESARCDGSIGFRTVLAPAH